MFDIAIFSYDKWFNDGKLVVTGQPDVMKTAVYRGWMMKPEQYRIFYINHKPAAISRNSGQEDGTPLPPQELIKKYMNLDSPFYTIDYAELADGSWRILEAGDGEVSGLPEAQNHEHFFRVLYQCFKDV